MMFSGRKSEVGEEGVSSVGGCGSLLTARLSRHSASACGEPLRPLGDIAMINAYDNQLIPMYVFPSTGHSLAKPAHIPVNTANQECVPIISTYFSKFVLCNHRGVYNVQGGVTITPHKWPSITPITPLFRRFFTYFRC